MPQSLLDSLNDFLSEYIGDSEADALDESKFPAVYAAVCELEKHYGGPLPLPAKREWKRLLKARKRADHDEAENAAMDLQDWVMEQIWPPQAEPSTGDDVASHDDPLMELLSIWDARQNQPRQIIDFLWRKRGLVNWDALPPEAFRGNKLPSDDGILKALKRIKTDLADSFEKHKVDLEIMADERRVRLTKPPDKPDK